MRQFISLFFKNFNVSKLECYSEYFEQSPLEFLRYNLEKGNTDFI